MYRYIARRLLQNAFVLWALVTLMFVMFRVLPGDPVSIVMSGDLTEKARQAMSAAWGLDRPLWQQYITYIANLAQGNFGISFLYSKPVWDVLEPKLINTIVLMLPATLLAVLLGVLGGMYFGWRRGSSVESLGILLPPIIRGIPVFWLGILILMVFSYGLGWFPNGGMYSTGAVFPSQTAMFLSADFLRHLALPLLCMVITSIPEPMMIMRTSMLEVKGEDYLELLEAKGVSEWVLVKHAARGSLLPVMTWVFHMLGYAVASTVVIEVVFAWPGLGREIVTAVNAYDYPLAQTAFFLISVTIVTLNMLLDISYGVLDPRVVLE